MIFKILLVVLAVVVLLPQRRNYFTYGVRIFFGLPGTGKSTMCARLAKKAKKKGLKVYANFPISGLGVYAFDPREDIGKYQLDNALLLIDEAGIDFNSRKYKSLSQETIQWFKLVRHYKCTVCVFSQAYNDMDITLRRLASQLYLCTRSAIPGFFCINPIKRILTVDAQTHDIVDGYSIDKPLQRLLHADRYCGRLYWGYFDTYKAPILEEKEFNTYD